MEKIIKFVLRALAVLLISTGTFTLLGSFFAADTGVLFVPAALQFAAGVGCWYWSGSADRRTKGRALNVDAAIIEATQFMEAVNLRGAFAEVQAKRLISTDERPLLAVTQARLLELAAVRATNHAGTRINLAGVPILLGRSVPSSSTQLEDRGEGELGLTPDRMIFSGQKSIDIALSRITSVEIMLDGFTLTVTGRARPITFVVTNGLLWGQLVKNLISTRTDGRRLPEGSQLRAL